MLLFIYFYYYYDDDIVSMFLGGIEECPVEIL